MIKKLPCLIWLLGLVFAFACQSKKAINNVPVPQDEEKIIWGSSIQKKPGQERAETYAKIESVFQPLDIVRVYCESEKNKDIIWPDWLPKTKSAVISFKLPPSEILNGSSDAKLLRFFNSLPVDKKVWWSYFHEPEDDVKKGEFSAEEYRNAFDYIIDLQKKMNRPNIYSTVILMTYTLKPEAKLNWKDFIPSKVDLISWDGYHRGWPDIKSADIFAQARKVSAELGKPWAVTEVGVNRFNKADAAGNITVMDKERRRKLLADMSENLSTVKPLPQVVLYFNSIGANDPTVYDWTIWEEPDMIEAWKSGRKN